MTLYRSALRNSPLLASRTVRWAPLTKACRTHSSHWLLLISRRCPNRPISSRCTHQHCQLPLSFAPMLPSPTFTDTASEQRQRLIEGLKLGQSSSCSGSPTPPHALGNDSVTRTDCFVSDAGWMPLSDGSFTGCGAVSTRNEGLSSAVSVAGSSCNIADFQPEWPEVTPQSAAAFLSPSPLGAELQPADSKNPSLSPSAAAFLQLEAQVPEPAPFPQLVVKIPPGAAASDISMPVPIRPLVPSFADAPSALKAGAPSIMGASSAYARAALQNVSPVRWSLFSSERS